MKLCLVCSSGGHFLELYFLKEFWQGYDRFWVTFLGKDNAGLLEGEKAYNAFHPTNRNFINLLRNFFLARKVFKSEKPGVIVSSGAGIAVPFIYMAKLFGVKTVYVELQTRVHELSLTARLIYPVVDHLIVQWPELAQKYPKCEFAGQVL